MNTGEVIALLGVVVAINALSTAAIYKYINVQKKERDDQLKFVTQDYKRLNETVDAMVSWLEKDEVRECTYEAVIERLLHEANCEHDVKENILNVFKENKIESSRALNELMLYSNRKNRKLAAFRQLSESCGNLDSIFNMEHAKVIKPNEYAEIYDSCIARLKSRMRK